MKEKSVLQLFPGSLRPLFEGVAKKCFDLSEIRIRAERPVMIYRLGKEYYLTEEGEEKLACANKISDALCLETGQVDNLFSYLCQYSPYA